MSLFSTLSLNTPQIYKTPFQRINHVAFEGSSTYSSLEIYPHSQVLQGFFQTVPKYQPTNILLLCEVSILHVFHKNVQQRLQLSITPPTTISPNLLGLEGSKRINGDPDNSALTGGGDSSHNSRRIGGVFVIVFMAFVALLAVGVCHDATMGVLADDTMPPLATRSAIAGTLSKEKAIVVATSTSLAPSVAAEQKTMRQL